MKELSIEEKAKAYDGVRDKITLRFGINVAKEIFSQFEESEDERIRKWLIRYFKEVCDNVSEKEKKAVIDWLEKQGEKPQGKSALEAINEEKVDNANKVEPFDKYEGFTDFERTLADICIGWIGEEHGWKQYIKDNADVLLKVAAKKFNSVQDAPFEQKPAWNEEDELVVAKILCICNDFERSFESSPSSTKVIKEDVDKIDTWLKSLKERYTWKPSDEQMRVLDLAIRCGINRGTTEETTLVSLFNDLKKLKE